MAKASRTKKIYVGREDSVADVIWFIIFVLFIFSYSFVHAQSPAGAVSGTGTHFEVTDGNYLNVTLDSSEEITAVFESVPKMVSIAIQPSSAASSTILTMNGFQSNAAYLKFEDSHKNKTQITTNQDGIYVFAQDLTNPHHVWFQETDNGTIFLPEDCPTVGNLVGSTCILTQNLTETVEITRDNITLDCDNRSITGSGTANGVYVFNKSGVSVTNCAVSNFSIGVLEVFASGNSLLANTISNSVEGALFRFVSGSSIQGNNIHSIQSSGIGLGSSPNNEISGNRLIGNNSGVIVYSSGNMFRNNIVQSNVTGFSLGFSSNSNEVVGNIVKLNQYGITLAYSDDNLVRRNDIISNQRVGLLIGNASGNRIFHNNFSDNDLQAYVQYDVPGNFFDNGPIDGGNYWSDYDTSVEGCNDINADGRCDLPYIFVGGQDNFPWITQDGWTGITCTPIDPNVLANTPLLLADGSSTTLQQSPLAGLAPVFIAKGCQHHVDPRFMAAIAAHESLLGLGLPSVRHVNPLGQATTTDDGFFTDGLGRQWQWKAGTKFCGKFNPFGLLLGGERKIFDCVTGTFLVQERQPFKFDSYNVAIDYLSQLLAADWLYFTGNEKCKGPKTTVSGIADNQGTDCGYTGPGEETSWTNGVSSFLGTLSGNSNDVRNPAGFEQPRPDREETSDDYLLISDPLDILVTDPQGRRIGFDVISRQVINEIPGATFSGRGTSPTRISIPAPLDGEYSVLLLGTTDSPYILQLFSQNASGTYPRIVAYGDVTTAEQVDIQFQHDFERGSSLPFLLDIKPETINPRSQGEFTAFLTVPKGLDIHIQDVSTSTIRLEAVVPVKIRVVDNKQLIAHFTKRHFSDIFLENNELTLNLTGALNNGTSISAKDTVRLLDKNIARSLSLLLVNLQAILSRLFELMDL